MKTGHYLRIFFAFLLFAATQGCIVHDQIVTLTLNPDGSGDMILFRSGIRSTESGEAAEREIEKYRDSFDAKTPDIFKQIRESGAHLDQATWIRRQVPAAHVIQATFPDAETLETFLTLRDADGVRVVKPTFSQTETRRRLSFQLTVEPDSIHPPNTDPAEAMKRAHATAVSVVRIALSAGTFTDARGFAIARDRQAAMLDETEIRALLHANEGDIFVEWDVPDGCQNRSP